MPLPTPNDGEKESDFISRCIPVTLEQEGLDSDSEADRKQATAICYSQWRKKHESEAEHTEVEMPFSEIGQLANHVIEVALAIVNGSGEITKERANKVLRKWEAELEELERAAPLADSASFTIDGQSVSLDELKEAYQKLHEAKTKTVGGKKYPASDFLVVEDSDAPSTWHLQVKRNGTPDHNLMGGAWAALHEGYRGNKYEGPNKQEAVTKLKALYKSEDMETPSEQAESMADVLQEASELIDKARGLGEVRGSLRDTAYRVEDAFHAAFSPKDRWEGPYRDRDVFMGHPVLGDVIVVDHRDDGQTYAIKFTDGEGGIEFVPRAEWQAVELVYLPKQAAQAEAEMESSGLAVEVARDATDEDTAALSEAEAAAVETGRRAPVVIDFQVLTPGPGNKRDGHYYPADVVKRDIHVFEGVDVFACDHKEEERSERTKVGKVLSCPTRFTEAEAPVAQVLIYDPNQAEKARNRADADALGTLECSIFGNGRAQKGEIEGKEYKIVEALTKGIFFELVSKAGAGGKALNLAESERSPEPSGSGQGGESMEEKEKAEATPVEEVEIEEANADEPQKLETEVVKEAVGKTNLPEFAKTALLAREYATDDELKEAVDGAIAEVKKLTGSGQVTDLGESEVVDAKPPSERDSILKFNEIMAEVGLDPVPVPDEEEAK